MENESYNGNDEKRNRLTELTNIRTDTNTTADINDDENENDLANTMETPPV